MPSEAAPLPRKNEGRDAITTQRRRALETKETQNLKMISLYMVKFYLLMKILKVMKFFQKGTETH